MMTAFFLPIYVVHYTKLFLSTLYVFSSQDVIGLWCQRIWGSADVSTRVEMLAPGAFYLFIVEHSSKSKHTPLKVIQKSCAGAKARSHLQRCTPIAPASSLDMERGFGDADVSRGWDRHKSGLWVMQRRGRDKSTSCFPSEFGEICACWMLW